ncbi:unnamed protein product [Ambrosiozyma monospora]|uniref:Unnamed protein product n=1 Tax=Ambrosiozyma monospora TaxID=43982 RepID=A0ACB5U9M8_AMBMO|nr:unnamed protein product [Ambrosiozyma monospora]
MILNFDLSLKGDQAYPPDQDALLEKFESRYSKGKKQQPRAQFTATSAPPVLVSKANKLDLEGMKPFLGELESKVSKQAPIDASTPATSGGSGSGLKAPSSTSATGSVSVGVNVDVGGQGYGQGPSQGKRSSGQRSGYGNPIAEDSDTEYDNGASPGSRHGTHKSSRRHHNDNESIAEDEDYDSGSESVVMVLLQ